MKKKICIFYMVVAIMGVAYLAFADFSDVGKQGNAYERAESLKSQMQSHMNRLVAFGEKVDNLKTRINSQLGAPDAAVFQARYINPMNTLLNDVNTAWQAAR